MANEIRNVVVAGPNGTLGEPVIKHIRQNGFIITLLTRNLDKTKQQFPDLTAVGANYDSVEDLIKLFRAQVGSQDALVVLINRDELQAQINVMEAAAKAGIPHIIPSSFGIGSRDSILRKFPIWETKVKMEDWVIEKATEEKLFTFTGIQTGVFFDWALGNGVLLNFKADGSPTTIFDGGDISFSNTTLDDIGKAVAAALKKADQMRNRWVFVHSAAVTQNQLLSYAREAAPEKEFKVLNLDTAEMESQAWEKYNRGERGREVMRGFMPRATFGYGIGFFKQTDNELLGVEEWSTQKVKEFIAGYVK